MKLNNYLNTAKLKIFYIVGLGFIIGLGIYLYFEKISNVFILGFISALIIIYITILFRKLNYLYLENTSNKIIVRYYSAFPLLRKYKSFEIPTEQFLNYEIKSFLFGFNKYVQFSVKTQKGVLKYPPVSITLLTKKQVNSLVKILNEIKA